MNIFLWIVQGLLAAMFFMAGFMKLTRPKAELSPKMGDWVETLSDSSLKGIGFLELMGALGLILPLALNVVPILTPLAAIGLALTMIGAMVLHVKRSERDKVVMNIVLLLPLLLIVAGRLLLLPVV